MTMSARIHLFCVGLENHQMPTLTSAPYAGNNARQFTTAWQALGVAATDCVTLLDEQATRTAIESAFRKFLKGVTRNDTVVFFFSGHGADFEDRSFLTAHDTQPDDIQLTSIPLASILSQIDASDCERALLFIDASDKGLPISDDTQPPMSGFSGEELKPFCGEAPHRVAFSACQPGESSWANPALKLGIWSHALIQALTANAMEALDKDHRLTCALLGKYLGDEVPRLLRITRTGAETQTPCSFGSATRSFAVADLAQILAERSTETNALGSALKDASLRGETLGPVRRLSGFKKGHHVPDRHASAAEAFVRRAGHDEVRTQMDAIHDRVRRTFGYRRKDVSYVCEDGAATLKSPDFDVNLSIAQDLEDATGYVLRTEVGAIRRPAVVTEDGFSEVFSDYCDTLVIEFSRSLNVENRIDQIEAIPALNEVLEYEADCSSFTLTFRTPGIRIHTGADRMTLSLSESSNIKTLLSVAESALAGLNNSGVTFLADRPAGE
jgi:uncharacterized caspase-like protein